MKGVIVHEWIEKHGGAEQVLDEVAETFPEADMMCLWSDAPERFQHRSLWESPLARTPLRKHKAIAFAASAAVWQRLPGNDYDWAIVSSHGFAHHARFKGQDQPRKYVYAHSPARYLWTPTVDDRGNSPLVRAVAPAFRALDRRRSREAFSVAANSEYVAQRIADTWGLPARVIHPPVRVADLQRRDSWADDLSADEVRVLEGLPRQFLLGASRFIPYKELDLVIRAGEASGTPVVLAGRGPMEAQLRELGAEASVPVHFVISPSDELLFSLYERAVALIFPALEDFGIVPVEAMALGTPVVSRADGGVIESVRDGVTGAHVAEWSSDSLRDAVDRVASLDRSTVREGVAHFDSARFRREIRQWVLGQ